MNQMLELSAKDFKAIIVKVPQHTITNSLEKKGKKKEEKIRCYKKEPKGDYSTEKNQ